MLGDSLRSFIIMITLMYIEGFFPSVYYKDETGKSYMNSLHHIERIKDYIG